jgi:hypothetical protein
MVFNQLLIKQLLEIRRVDLPLFGSIVVDRHPAKIDYTNQQIYPPALSLRFIQDQIVEEVYCPEFNFKYINNIGNLKEQYVEALTGNLAQTGVCEIQHVGIFERSQSTVIFKADTNSPFFSAYSEFEPIQFTPVRRVVASNLSNVVDLKKKKWHWKAKAMVFLLVVNLCILALAGINILMKDINIAVPTKLPEERVNVKPSNDLPLPNAIPMPNEDTLNESNIMKDSIGILDDSEGSMDSVVQPMKDTSVDITVQTDQPLRNESKELNLNHKKNLELDPQKIAKSCYIIVGSFSNLDNANKLVSQIEINNYKPYTQKVGGMTRVGITLECSQVDIELDKIKRTFNDQAWILN